MRKAKNNGAKSDMNTEVKSANKFLDVLKWLLAIAFLSAAVVGNYWFADQLAFIYRILIVVALMLVAVGFAAITEHGVRFRTLLREANVERRKVVWPTRPETVQTTLIVVAVVFLMAMILWGLDSILGFLVSLLIG